MVSSLMSDVNFGLIGVVWCGLWLLRFLKKF